MIRILIADDHPLLRRGVKEILVRELKGAICGEAENAQEALAQVRNQEWELVILDITLPGRSGMEVLREMKQTLPKVPVLILSAHSEEQFGKVALRAGAWGYMKKDERAGRID